MLCVNLIVYIVVSKLQWHLIVCGIIIGLSVFIICFHLHIVFPVNGSDIYIGGTDYFSNSTYFWEDGDRVSNTYLTDHGITLVSHGCLILKNLKSYSLDIATCTEHLKYICTKEV